MKFNVLIILLISTAFSHFSIKEEVVKDLSESVLSENNNTDNFIEHLEIF